MKHTSFILQKIFVREFYRANSSFFLLVLGVAGGFMRGEDHIALAEFFISSPIFLLIPVVVWIGYTLKLSNFNAETLRSDEYRFIFNLNLFSSKEQWLLLIPIAFNQLAPIIVYGSFLISIATRHSFIFSGVLIVLIIVLLLFFLVKQIQSHLINPNYERKVSMLKKIIDKRFVKIYALIVVEWLSRTQLLMLVSFKIFSIVLLFAVMQLYKVETYDLRLLHMALLLAFASTAPIVFQIHRFNNLHFSILRQLPLNLFQRMGNFLLTIFILSIPEVGLLVQYFKLSSEAFHFLKSFLFAFSIPFLIYGWLYVKDREQERLTSYTFSFSMITIVLILFKIPVELLAMINTSLAIILWKRYYYSFEYISKL